MVKALQRIMRSLLAMALAYALLLQSSAMAAQAGAHLAMASSLPAALTVLCSGARIPGQDIPGLPDHDPASQSSCCSWNGAGTIEPFVPPAPPQTGIVYRLERDCPQAVRDGPPQPQRFRAASAQGSRAPPVLVS